jgi:CelD/BcsL family acetyltransferase involved in cellulose biosynthesis
MLHVPRSNLRLRGELLTCDDLPRILPAWKALCDDSAEDNVYYSPRYSQALLDNVEEKNIALAAVWAEASLVALLPFSRSRIALAGLRAAGRAWQNKFIFSCTPLLDAVRKIEAAGVLLDVLASVSEGEWIVPTVNTKGQACRALVAALSARRMPWAFSQPFQRAILEIGPTFEEHMQRHVAASRRKGLLRNQRRLQQLGKLDHETHCYGAQLDQTLAAYLEIEASGWKGRRGTALACHETTRKFALAAFSGEKGNSNCRADVLTLDGAHSGKPDRNRGAHGIHHKELL